MDITVSAFLNKFKYLFVVPGAERSVESLTIPIKALCNLPSVSNIGSLRGQSPFGRGC